MMALALGAVLSIPFVVLIAELAAGLLPQAKTSSYPAVRTAILIPAHNEADGIGSTIASIRAASPPGVRILVVADNCTDETARTARALGVEVAERSDANQRGKGFALAFGRDVLAEDPPESVVVIDADCVVHDDAIVRIAALSVASARPIQALYLMDPPVEEDSMGRVSAFAFLIKNGVRQRGLSRIANTCVLTGTGMAFPWPLFASAPLATADSVEDLALGLHFVVGGVAPQFCESARVTSAAAPKSAAIAQRTRWEHGFVATALKKGPHMLGQALVKRSWAAFWLALHLTVPPLALLVIVGAVLLGSLALLAPGAAMVFGSVYVTVLLVVFVAWLGVGRTILPPALLLKVPGYIVWKLPIYLRLARGADRRWTRTERD
jgi:glycosyltransferase involved in cell wall biosynthesis